MNAVDRCHWAARNTTTWQYIRARTAKWSAWPQGCWPGRDQANRTALRCKYKAQIYTFFAIAECCTPTKQCISLCFLRTLKLCATGLEGTAFASYGDCRLGRSDSILLSELHSNGRHCHAWPRDYRVRYSCRRCDLPRGSWNETSRKCVQKCLSIFVCVTSFFFTSYSH